jgi:hypothetical protein
MTPDLSSTTATICRLVGINASADVAAPLEPVVAEAEQQLGGRPAERVLVYAPDAIGRHLYDPYSGEFDIVRRHAPLEVEVTSMVPSITPVCFASMFTGLRPKEHGITGPIKPVLGCDTLFDMLIRAGKRTALIATEGSSMSLIFGGRGPGHKPESPWRPIPGIEDGPMHYVTVQYDAQVSVVALRLLRESNFDVIVAYHMQYDDLLHLSGPFSPEALLAFRLHLASFDRLATAARTAWQGRSHALCFVSDHGAHWDEEKRMGKHGTELPADMELVHFWGVYPA